MTVEYRTVVKLSNISRTMKEEQPLINTEDKNSRDDFQLCFDFR
jgi:hypothetical protein